MAPRRRRRFLGSGDDLEAKRAREEKSVEECARLDLDDSPDIAESTEERRKRLMTEWKDYFGLLKDPGHPGRTIDPDSVWLNLCLNDDLAKARCVAFLKAYVKDSEQEFPILVPLEETGEEPQETEWRRTVTSANGVASALRAWIIRTGVHYVAIWPRVGVSFGILISATPLATP